MASASAVRGGRVQIEIGGDEGPLARALDRALEKLKAFGLSVAKIGISLTGLGALPLGTLLTLAKFSASAGSALQNLATQTGLSVGQLAALQSMAKLAGVDVAGVAGAFNNLNKEIVALNAGAVASVSAFARLGIQYKDLAGQSTFSQFVKVADAIAKLPTPAERAAAALDIFGKSGAALLPVINQGGKAIEEAAKRFGDLGIIIGAEAAASVAAFDDVLTEIILQMAAIKNVIGAAAAEIFLPIARAIEPILGFVIRWADANRTLVGRLIVLSAVAITFGAALTVLGVAIAASSVAISGFVTVLGVILSPIRLAFTAATGLASAIVRVGSALAAVSVSSALSLASGFITAAAGATRLVSTISRLLLLGPILTAATAAAGLLGSTLFAIGSAIVAAVPVVVTAVAGLAGTMVSAVVGTFVAIYTPLLGFIAAIEIAISTALLGAVSAIAPAAGAIVLAITSQFGLLVPAIALIGAALAPILIVQLLGGADEVRSAIAGFFSGVADSISGTLAGIGDAIGGAFAGVARFVSDSLSAIPELVRRAFSGLRDIGASSVAGLRDALSSIVGFARDVFASVAAAGASAWRFISTRVVELGGVVRLVVSDILAALSGGQFELAASIATKGIGLAWLLLQGSIQESWSAAVRYVLSTGVTLYVGLLKAFESIKSGIVGVFIDIAAGIGRAWARVQAFILNTSNNTFAAVEIQWINLQEQLGLITSQQAALQRGIVTGAAAIRQAATENQLLSNLSFRDIAAAILNSANTQALNAKIQELKDYEAKLQTAIANRDAGAKEDLEKRILAARKELEELQKQIKPGGIDEKLLDKFREVFGGAGLAGLESRLKASVAFGAVDINQVLRGVDTQRAQDRTAAATEVTARNTGKIIDKLDEAITIA